MGLQIYPTCEILDNISKRNCWFCRYADICAANKTMGCTTEENYQVLGIKSSKEVSE